MRIRIGLPLFAAACCNPSGAARQLPFQESLGYVRNFELLQISRERSKKTEAVFLVALRGSGGKSKSLRARFLLPAFSFGEAKENAEGQSQISNMSPYIGVYIVDHKNRSVQTDFLTGEQSLDSCLEGGKLRGVQAVRSLNDGGCGLLGIAQRFQIHLQARDL